MPYTSHPLCTSSQEFQHLVMDLAVCAQELARINRSLAAKIRRASAGFFDDDTQRCQVPRLRRPIECCFNRTLGEACVARSLQTIACFARRPAVAEFWFGPQRSCWGPFRS